MAHIKMYKTPVCPYCQRAKSLLSQKGITDIEEIDISTDPSLRDEMMQAAGGRKTVPQIFIDGEHIGGLHDLYALDKKGELDPKLAA